MPTSGFHRESGPNARPRNSAATIALRIVLPAALLILVVGLFAANSLSDTNSPPSRTTEASAATPNQEPGRVRDALHPGTLDELMALDPADRKRVDIARANLLVAKALPETEAIDIDASLSTINDWLRRVASETQRYLPRFRQNPAEFQSSEAYFRMLTLVTVLQQDCGVAYNPDRIRTPDFSDPADLFIHGMIPLDGRPATGGTCVSMPVLYAAVARRLGYPVALVTTKGHVFLRWEDDTDRFNIETTSQGLTTFPDDHYRSWPLPVTQQEIDAFGLLQPLSRDEELALFLASAGHVLHEHARIDEAIAMYKTAAALDADNALYPGYAAEARTRPRGIE